MATTTSSPEKDQNTSVENLKVSTETMDESQDKSNYRQCNICFEDTKPDMLVNTPCGHIFCCNCFFEWMKQNYTCPCCRTLLIKREESQLETLRVNREEIAVQEEHMGELQDDVNNLRRLQTIHKRRIKKLKKSNEEQMGRQIRLREMLSETRRVRDGVVKQIQHIIPRNKLEKFTTSFYTNLVSGDSEKALQQANNLIMRASLHEWKKRNGRVMTELCSRFHTGRSDSFLDKCFDEIMENTSGNKRNNSDMYSLSESETSDEEKHPEYQTVNEESASRSRARRRLRIPSRLERRLMRAENQALSQTETHIENMTTVLNGIAGNSDISQLYTILNNYQQQITYINTNNNITEDEAASTPETESISPDVTDITPDPLPIPVTTPLPDPVSDQDPVPDTGPVPNFTFTMPDTGEQIEFSWEPPAVENLPNNIFVFGVPENRDDEGNE